MGSNTHDYLSGYRDRASEAQRGLVAEVMKKHAAAVPEKGRIIDDINDSDISWEAKKAAAEAFDKTVKDFVKNAVKDLLEIGVNEPEKAMCTALESNAYSAVQFETVYFFYVDAVNQKKSEPLGSVEKRG